MKKHKNHKKHIKKLLVMSSLVFASAFGAKAQNNTLTASSAKAHDKAYDGKARENNNVAAERAKRLSDQMIRELKLNNFQSNRLREINQEKISKMTDIEQRYAYNPELVDQNCKGVCKERDNELESFLSTDQYSMYYGARNKYYKTDKEFAAQIGAIPTIAAKNEKPVLPLANKVVPVKRSTTVVSADVSR
jgi:hypothetical protein